MLQNCLLSPSLMKHVFLSSPGVNPYWSSFLCCFYCCCPYPSFPFSLLPESLRPGHASRLMVHLSPGWTWALFCGNQDSPHVLLCAPLQPQFSLPAYPLATAIAQSTHFTGPVLFSCLLLFHFELPLTQNSALDCYQLSKSLSSGILCFLLSTQLFIKSLTIQMTQLYVQLN